MSNWYVIQTKPQRENDVSKHLSMAKIEVLNAKIRSYARGVRPLFPNYIFVNHDLLDSNNYRMIKYTRGVNKILGTYESPVPISEGIIDVIKERLKGDVVENKILSVGARVKIRKGLLRDLVGVIEKPVSAEGRISVLLNIYEREMKAMLHCKDVLLVVNG